MKRHKLLDKETIRDLQKQIQNEKNAYLVSEKLEYLNKINLNKNKIIERQTAIICICWGDEYIYLLENFFFKELEKEVTQKAKKNISIFLATDICSFLDIKNIKSLKNWDIEFVNCTKIIWDKNLNCYQKLGIIFQNTVKMLLKNNAVQNVLLLNPDQMFSKKLFDHLILNRPKKACSIIAPLRCCWEEYSILKRDYPELSLKQRALESLHQMQKDLTIYSPKSGFTYIQRSLAAEPWGFGIWVSEKKYIFKAIIYAMCALNLAYLRKKDLKIDLSKCAPDIGFLEKFNLRDNDIDWIEDANEKVSVDVSNRNRNAQFYLGNNFLIKLLAKRFAFINVGQVNKFCFKKLFHFCDPLTSNEKRKVNKILRKFFFLYFKEKVQTYLKWGFSRKIRRKIKNHVLYDFHLKQELY